MTSPIFFPILAYDSLSSAEEIPASPARFTLIKLTKHVWSRSILSESLFKRSDIGSLITINDETFSVIAKTAPHPCKGRVKIGTGVLLKTNYSLVVRYQHNQLTLIITPEKPGT